MLQMYSGIMRYWYKFLTALVVNVPLWTIFCKVICQLNGNLLPEIESPIRI